MGCGPQWAVQRRIRRSAAPRQGHHLTDAHLSSAATLKRMGGKAAMVLTDRDDAGTRLPIETAPVQRSGLRTEIGNAATEVDAAWHGRTEIKPVN